MHATAEALMAALQAQVRTGRLIQAVQLSLDSPCPGWSVRDVLNHSIGVTLKFAGFASTQRRFWSARPRRPGSGS